MTNIFKFSKHLIVLCVFILALCLRVYKTAEYTAFSQDQAKDLLYILDHLENREPILIGPKTSVGNFYVGPLYYYLITPVVWAFPDQPAAPAFVIALIDSFCAAGLVILFKRYFSLSAGVIAGVLYATSPLALQFSRFGWNPNAIPFFSLVFLYFLIAYYQERKFYQYLLMSLSCVCAIQLHYQSIILLFPQIFVTVITLSRKSFKHVLGGAIIGVSTFIPFFIYELTHNFFNIRNIQDYFFNVHKYWYQRVTFVGFFYDFIPGFFGRLQGFNLHYGQLLFWGFLLLTLVYLVIRIRELITLKFKLWSMKKLVPIELIMIFFILILIGLRSYKGDKLDYYMAILYTFPPIIIGTIYALGNKFVKPLVVIFALILLSGNIIHSPLVNLGTSGTAKNKSIAEKIIDYYPDKMIYVQEGEEAYSNPVRYFLKIKHRLADNRDSGINIKICENNCGNDYQNIIKIENTNVYEKNDNVR